MKADKQNQSSRRKFLQQSAAAGLGVLAGGNSLFANESPILNEFSEPILAKGYAARDDSGKLSSWEFKRRHVGDNEILIDIKFSGVCHSDIHTVRGEWGDQQYPLVPGHEIAGIVSAVGKNVRKFRVGDKAGIGCMVESCMTCDSCLKGEEHYCENGEKIMTYGTAYEKSPSGISQGGYSNKIVVDEHFGIKIPESLDLAKAAPLLCAGITTYSPLMKAQVQKNMKVGVAGIGGLGHMALKIAISKCAEVYAFTTTPDKVSDIEKFGVKEVIVVDSLEKLDPYKAQLDYMISTIPVDYNLGAYASLVKPNGFYTQVGLPATAISFSNFDFIGNRVNFNGSLIGGIPETQEMINYCAQRDITPDIQMIDPEELNDVYEKVVNKEARYRYVINAEKF